MQLTQDQLETYDRDGILVFPELFSQAEVAVLRGEVERLKTVEDECIFREGESNTPKIVFKMDDPDCATYSAPFRALSRTPRALATARQVLRDDALYMHHFKLNMKAAIEGTVWQWHQDYMPWQIDGIQKPDMTTMLVMLEDNSEMGGCLYFLPRTHEMGRIEPYLDESTVYKLWATPVEQIKAILARSPDPVPITGKAGTAALFHCNTLHASGHNLSHRDRWQVYMSYNRCSNHPHAVENPRPDYVRGTDWTPLELESDDAILGAVEVAS